MHVKYKGYVAKCLNKLGRWVIIIERIFYKCNTLTKQCGNM